MNDSEDWERMNVTKPLISGQTRVSPLIGDEDMREESPSLNETLFQAASTRLSDEVLHASSNNDSGAASYETHKPDLLINTPCCVSFGHEESQQNTIMIDNSTLVYIPMILKCGVTVHCRPDVLARCPSVLRDLNLDIVDCLDVLPTSVHGLVKRTQIWVSTSYYYGPRKKPKNVNHSTAHHHEGWLLWVKDNPEKAQGIEIYNCFEYQKMRLHWNGCGLILHELAHLIHQLVIPEGLDDPTICELYANAKKSRHYNSVLRRDWAGAKCDTDMAYAMVNHKEFFAEISVTYLSDNYHALDETGGESMVLSSPPLLAPSVLKRFKNECKRPAEDFESCRSSKEIELYRCTSSIRSVEQEQQIMKSIPSFISKLVWFLFRKPNISIQMQTFRHCNKFYPFTRGQLRHHDPELYEVFQNMWKDIADWDDPAGCIGCGTIACWRWK